MATRSPLRLLIPLLHALRRGLSTLAPLLELPSRHRFPVDFNRHAVAVDQPPYRPGATLQRLLQHPLERPLRSVGK